MEWDKEARKVWRNTGEFCSESDPSWKTSVELGRGSPSKPWLSKHRFVCLRKKHFWRVMVWKNGRGCRLMRRAPCEPTLARPSLTSIRYTLWWSPGPFPEGSETGFPWPPHYLPHPMPCLPSSWPPTHKGLHRFPPSAGFLWEHLWVPRPATASLPWHLMGCFGFSTFYMSMTVKCLLSHPIWAQVYMAIASPLGWFTNPTYLKLNSNFLLRMHAFNISYQWIYLHPVLYSLFLYDKQWMAILRYQFEHYFFDLSLSHPILVCHPSTVYSSKYPGFPTPKSHPTVNSYLHIFIIPWTLNSIIENISVLWVDVFLKP